MEQHFSVSGMKCGGCVATVQATIEALAGVEAVSVDLAAQSARVRGNVDAQRVIDALRTAGYTAQRRQP